MGCAKGRKVFFFEKKKQKTFILTPSQRCDTPATDVPERIKVFWFFFSKKNTSSLPYSLLG
jgi:hypothetical protein